MRKVELAPLTGIRFYAALLVYLYHVLIIPGMEALAGGRWIFNAGDVGVSFFFVLSGFILTYNYADVFRNGLSLANYRRFVWDRFTKIYPVHLAALLMVLPLAILSPNLPLDRRALPFHLLLLQCFWPSATPAFYAHLNVPSWSISCEWFFYLLAPMAMFFAMGNRRFWVPVLVVVAYACGGWFLWAEQTDSDRLYFVSWFAPSRFVEFLVGVFLGRLFLTAPRVKVTTAAGFAQATGIALIVAGAMYRPHAGWPFLGGLLYVPGSALLLLGLAYGRGFFVNHLSQLWLTRLGTASFSFYLIHAPMLRTAKGACIYLGWEVHSWAAFWAVAVGLFVVVQAAAFVVCYRYEIPLQKRLRSLLRTRTTSPVGFVPQYGG